MDLACERLGFDKFNRMTYVRALPLVSAYFGVHSTFLVINYRPCILPCLFFTTSKSLLSRLAATFKPPFSGLRCCRYCS